jgi:putative FmdB family regulatory protein
MPTYEYRCESCGTNVEVVQGFSDAPLTTCEQCGGTLRKVYAPVGIVFKGSGFYKTDSRTSASKPASRSSSDAGGDGHGASTESSSTTTPTSTTTSTTSAPKESTSSPAPAAKPAASTSSD